MNTLLRGVSFTALLILGACSRGGADLQIEYTNGSDSYVQVHDCTFVGGSGVLDCLVVNKSGGSIRPGQFRAAAYDEQGTKLNDDSLDVSLAPGETGKERFALFDGASRIVIR